MHAPPVRPFTPIRATGLWSVLLVVTLALAACAPDASRSGSSGAVLRDSAGVTVVENEPLPAEAGGLRVGPEPALEIGVLEGDPADQLYRVSGAARLDDGRVVVANAGTSEIRVYDPSGRHAATWGGAGEGPGEFLGIRRMVRWPGDSLAVWDVRTRRITLFSRDGDLGRSFPLPTVAGMDFPDFVGVLPSGALVVSQTEFGDQPTTGHLRMPVRVALVRPDGELVADFGRHPGQEAYMSVGPGSVQILRPDHARSYVLAPVGERVLVGPNDRFELRFWKPDGELERIVRLAEPPRAVTESERDLELRRRLDEAPAEHRPGIREARERMPLPDTLPAISGVVPDVRGHLWVRASHLPDADSVARWIVLDPAGRAVGAVALPAELEVFEIGNDWLLGAVTDDLGVERVQVWSLRREG